MAPQEPFRSTAEGKLALAKVLIDIRSQAGCTNWDQFSAKAAVEAGLEIPVPTIEQYAPTPRYGNVPNPGLFYAIGMWSTVRNPPFVFDNGETIDERTLYEVLLEVRAPSGELLNSRNGKPRA